MIMVMRWDGICSRSQSYLHGTLRHDAVALLHTREYLHTLAVALAERHLLLAIALCVYLHVDEVDAPPRWMPCSSVRAVRGSVMTLWRSWVMRYISA